jgi:uncharacterized membrane protein
MPVTLRDRLSEANWQLILAAPVAAGVLHICATLAAPYLTADSAYNRLAPALPINRMRVLPEVAPGSEPLPFLSPDARYALCRFDTSAGPVTVTAILPPDPGWMLSVISPQGDNIYVSASTPGRPTPITLALVPSEEHFLGVTPEARGVARDADPPVALAAKHGIVVIRAADHGAAYQRDADATLSAARCSATRF